jgi:hypothetical protein
MIAFLSSILHVVVSPFKTKAGLEAEIIMLRQDRAAEVTAELVREGFAAFKVKVGGDPQDDIARVRGARMAPAGVRRYSQWDDPLFRLRSLVREACMRRRQFAGDARTEMTMTKQKKPAAKKPATAQRAPAKPTVKPTSKLGRCSTHTSETQRKPSHARSKKPVTRVRC